MSGRLVYSSTATIINGNAVLHTESLRDGVYILELATEYNGSFAINAGTGTYRKPFQQYPIRFHTP